MVDRIVNEFLFRWYKDRLNLEGKEKVFVNLHKVPKVQKGKFNEMGDLVLFDHPDTYNHMAYLQYNYAFLGYFCGIGLLSSFTGIRLFYKKQSYKALFALGSIGLTSFIEGWAISNKVRDVKTVLLRGHRTLILKTFQSEEEASIDLEDLRIVNKHNEELLVLSNAQENKEKQFKFYFLEPCYATVSNITLFNAVLRDKRALKF